MEELDQQQDLLYRSEIAEPDWYKTNIPCQVGCPAHTDVATYIGLISQGRFDEAYLINRRCNVTPGVLGRTCARPCEPVCRRNKIDGKPVAICWLKRAAHDHREYRHLPERPQITKDKKVAIIGAGSAGVACARDLAEMGYPVTLYDSYSVAGGMMVGGIPIWRLPREVTYEETDEYMEALGVEMIFNTTVGRDVQLTDLCDQYDAVYIAAGCQDTKPITGPDNKLIPGLQYKGVEDGLRFLEKVNFGEPVTVGKKVVVLGGGFTAMDCCRSSIRFGAEKVYVFYRRTKEEMPSDEYEVDEALLEHVEFQYLLTQVEILSNDGEHVSGLKLIRNKLGDPDASGRRRPVPITGSEFVVECDTVIAAFGQDSDTKWIPKELNLEANRWGIPLIDRNTWMTSRPGLFAGGDYTEGSRNLISAIGDGRDAATAINRYLAGFEKAAEEATEIELPDFRRGMVDDYESIPYQIIPSLPLAKRFGISVESETGYSPAEAVEQARRCLQCQLNIMIDPSICILCSGCVDICPYDCISMEGLKSVVKGDALHKEAATWDTPDAADMIIDEEKCIRCGLCIVRCPTDAISMVKYEVASVNDRWNVSKIPVIQPDKAGGRR